MQIIFGYLPTPQESLEGPCESAVSPRVREDSVHPPSQSWACGPFPNVVPWRWSNGHVRSIRACLRPQCAADPDHLEIEPPKLAPRHPRLTVTSLRSTSPPRWDGSLSRSGTTSRCSWASDSDMAKSRAAFLIAFQREPHVVKFSATAVMRPRSRCVVRGAGRARARKTHSGERQ